ncbi:MAG: flagellar export chaperone FliS [Terriglobales bacterium]
MKRSPTERAYMTAALENASAAGLVIILFDLLVTDLKNAIAAMESRDIEKRTAELKHGFLVLQQLQGFVDMENGGDAAKHFSAFYSVIRCKMLEAQWKKSPEILQRQIELLLDVRQAWQQVSTPVVSPSQQSASASVSPAKTDQDEQQTASWTA